MGQIVPQNTNYSIYGHTFFGHNSAIFKLIWLKFFLGTQGTIIYRLVVKNHDFDAFLKKSIFSNKMGVAAMLAPTGLGLQDPTKKLAHQVKLLGQSLSQKNVFQNFGPEPPPLKQIRGGPVPGSETLETQF